MTERPSPPNSRRRRTASTAPPPRSPLRRRKREETVVARIPDASGGRALFNIGALALGVTLAVAGIAGADESATPAAKPATPDSAHATAAHETAKTPAAAPVT